MVLIVWKTAAPTTLRHLFAGTNSLVSKDVSHRLASRLVMAISSKGKWLDACKTSPTEQHGTAAKTLKYWSGVQCQTRGLFGQCLTGGVAVTKQALKPGLSNPFWVPSIGFSTNVKGVFFYDIAGSSPWTAMSNVVIQGIPYQDCKKIEVAFEIIGEIGKEYVYNMTANLQKKALRVGRKIEGKFDDTYVTVHMTNFPFIPGLPFKICIGISGAEFTLIFDDKVIHRYERQPSTNIRIVRVTGLLEVTDFQVEAYIG